MAFKIFVTVCSLLGTLLLGAQSESDLRTKIGRMIILGFDAQHLEPSDPFVRQLQRYHLGGVILFDRDFHDRNRTKNIASAAQLKQLTSQLKAYATAPLLIAVDQEGGRVARLKVRDGFDMTPSAEQIGHKDDPRFAKKAYDALAEELSTAGINTDFAPVVDLAVNPNNHVIYGLQRSYGATPQKVTRYAEVFSDALRRRGVVPVLKHFPGHGSSQEDSHEGFVDVTQTWKPVELEPYRRLISADRAEMIMTAHVYNRRLDPDYPATLSKKINTGLLRNELGFQGVIVSDDLQMKAISGRYSLRETVRLAINAGVDMLLFGNQLGQITLEEAVKSVVDEVRAGRISEAQIDAANVRIEKLFKRYGIGEPKMIEKPIVFGPQRIALTKQYIKQHYGKAVSDITIEPKVIVLHWTADRGLESSFRRMEPERLPGSRGDIVSAGVLNVSAHFLVARDGTIYRLMPENRMARHVIGLNFSSIGIENVGGEDNTKQDLTPAQRYANIALVRYLKQKYPDIEYLIGHHEYRRMESSPLWLERDKGYRTEKRDPGAVFMSEVRSALGDLGLKSPPKRR